MNSPLFPLVLAVTGFVAVLVWSESRKKKALACAAKHLGGEPSGNAVQGEAHGQKVSFRFATRGSGKSSTNWTEVDAPIPAVLLQMDVRPQTWNEVALRDRGLAVDVEVGDAEFDDAFLVEAAPADVVRRVLSPKIRFELIELRPVAVKTLGDTLRVEVYGHTLDPYRIKLLIDVCARMARLIPAAVEEVEVTLEAESAEAGTAYRSSPDEAARAAQKKREDEFFALEEVKRRRGANQTSTAAVLAIVFFVYLLYRLIEYR